MDSKILKEISAHPFVKFDIPLEAIDFHVSDIIEHCVFDISSEEFQNIRKAVVLASQFSIDELYFDEDQTSTSLK